MGNFVLHGHTKNDLEVATGMQTIKRHVISETDWRMASSVKMMSIMHVLPSTGTTSLWKLCLLAFHDSPSECAVAYIQRTFTRHRRMRNAYLV